jgi:hypothetical protein
MNRTTTVVVALIATAGLSMMVYAVPEQRAVAWQDDNWICCTTNIPTMTLKDPHATSLTTPSASKDPTLVVTERESEVQVPADSIGTVTAACNPGEVVTGGGFNIGAATGIDLVTSLKYTKGSEQGWEVEAANHLTQPIGVVAEALCASLAS